MERGYAWRLTLIKRPHVPFGQVLHGSNTNTVTEKATLCFAEATRKQGCAAHR